jgi:hypothetical protein
MIPKMSTPNIQEKNMERQTILSSTQKYKEALESQVSDLKKNAINITLQGLIFGGLALGTWFLVKSMTRESKEKDSSNALPAETSGFVSGIVASIQGAIASFLLSIAKEKIMQVIQNYMDKQNAASGNSQ